MNFDYAGLALALQPEMSLVIGALIVLGLDLSVFRRHSIDERLPFALAIGALAVIAAGVHTWCSPTGSVFGGVLILDSFAVATRIGILVLTLLTLGVTTATTTPRKPAEQVALILFATTGFMLMASAQQLLLAFLALELASLSLYVLAGFDQSRPASAEAGLKYFLFGGVAAAFLLFGFSLIYGLTGTIELPEISQQLSVLGLSPLLVVALVMVLVAFGFKAAAAPFHLWAPDVYQGAPTAAAALIASASKLAGFALFTRMFWAGFDPVAGDVSVLHGAPGWLPITAVVSALSLVLGNFAALAQISVRRLLAYSAIAHAGTLLLGVIAVGHSGAAPLFYYAATYGLATVGAFGVIAVVERTGRCDRITDLAGLHRRSPFLAGCLAIFILSLAGIPPLAGFFGKFFVFSAALQIGGIAGPAGWLTLGAIALSAVALYYYLIVLKQALVAVPAANAKWIIVPPVAKFTLAITAGFIVLFGLCPSLVLGLF